MVSKTGPATVEDLLAVSNDGYRYELVRGELRQGASGGFEHGAAAGNVFAALHSFVAANNLGRVLIAETGFLLAAGPDHVRAPDAAFVRRERVEAAGTVRGFWPGPPDLAVAVISPHDRYTEVDEKVDDWLAAGTRMVVVVNPRNRTTTVRLPGANPVILNEDDTLEGGEIVPGWSMPVADIFA